MDGMKAKILEALAGTERMTFQDIVGPKSDTGREKLNRNTVRKKLDELLIDQLIKEVNRTEWKQGQKLWFSITDKGRECIFKETWAVAVEDLKKVRKLTARIAQLNPKKLSEFRQYLKQPADEDGKNLEEGRLSVEDYFKRFQERTKDDPVREIFKASYDIFLKMNCLPHEIPKEGFAVAILEKGSVCLLDVALLRKRGFILRETEKELDLGFSEAEFQSDA